MSVKLCFYIVFVLAVLLGGNHLFAQEPETDSEPPAGTTDTAYKLFPADRVKISIYNQPDLSGDYTLDSDGRFFMPLIGSVEAEDLTPSELEALLVEKLKPDYLVNPRVFVQLMKFRPYYLVGEVGGRGEFPYLAGMTYLQAIAIAGGYSYRAKQDYVFVVRADDPTQQEIKLSVNEKVQPGDIIRVGERLF